MGRKMNKKTTKFTVGQTVKVVGKGLASKGWVGTISSVLANRRWAYYVTFPEGRGVGEYAENEIEIA